MWCKIGHVTLEILWQAVLPALDRRAGGRVQAKEMFGSGLRACLDDPDSQVVPCPTHYQRCQCASLVCCSLSLARSLSPLSLTLFSISRSLSPGQCP